jgi:FAD:protein FMN transferase
MERFTRPKWILACVFVLVLMIVLFSRKNPKVIGLNGKTMGTTFHIKYIDNGHGIKRFVISDDINRLLRNINQQMSTYIKDSELSLLNQSTNLDWQNITPDLFRVLEHALNVAKSTKGAFDPTIGPLVNLWGFGPNNKRKVPKFELIEATKKRVGYRYIELKKSPLSIKKLKPDLYIDLSASAKGYGVDVVSLHLRKLGIENHMIEIGGEVRVAGTKHGKPWRVGIESPGPNYTLGKKVLNLKNISLATSGNYRNYFESDGKKYSHGINFKTGRPVSHTLASVSVLSQKGCMDADAWATALMVLGPDKGLELAKELKIGAFFIYKKANQSDKDFIEVMTPEFKLFVEKGL